MTEAVEPAPVVRAAGIMFIAGVPDIGHGVCHPCGTDYIDDDRHWPHLKRGETALIDTRDRTIVYGELYLVRQSRGPMIWQICKEPRPDRSTTGRPTAWMRPLNNPPPRLDAKGRWDPTGCHLSDGPIYVDALEEMIIGRVVGLFVAAPYDPAIGYQRKGEAA